MVDKGMKRKLLVWAGYAAFFAAAFVISCYLTFPYERLRDYLVAEVAATQAQGRRGEPGWRLAIGDLGPHWLTGVSMDDVQLSKKPADEDEAATEIAFDELDLSVSPLSMLLGKKYVAFSGEIGDGEIDGEYEIAGEEGPTRFVADFDEVDVSRLGLGGALGVPVKGMMSGEIDVTLAKDPAETEGKVQMRIEALEIGDGKAKVPLPGMGSGLTLDTIQAGTLELELSVKEGIAALDKLEAKGDDLELSGSGSLRMLKPLGRSRPDITLSIKFADSYKQKSGRTKAAFDLMGNNPQIKRATAPDGALRFKLVGSLDSLRMNPAGPASVGPRRRPRK